MIDGGACRVTAPVLDTIAHVTADSAANDTTSLWPAAVALTVCLAACLGAASFGALFPPGQWYAGLEKPALNPPNWLFGPVWTGLYILMAIAAWLVWQRRGAAPVALPLTIFGVQLVINAAWSWIFFGLHRPGLALADIIVLVLAIVVTMIAFGAVRPVASLLLVPYLLWVCFASYLNFGLWRLNP